MATNNSSQSNPVFRRLLDVARDARANAYAPYSDFDAGAAVLTESGAIYRGVLVENLIFGLSMCAERAAMYAAVTDGGLPVTALALSAPSTAGDTTMPCGSCLQTAIELGSPDTVIVTGNDEGDLFTSTIDQLAPGIPRRGDA